MDLKPISLDQIANADRPSLVNWWQTYFKVDPPKGISQRLMKQAIAYQWQVKIHKVTQPNLRRRIDAGDRPAKQRSPAPPAARACCGNGMAGPIRLKFLETATCSTGSVTAHYRQ